MVDNTLHRGEIAVIRTEVQLAAPMQVEAVPDGRGAWNSQHTGRKQAEDDLNVGNDGAGACGEALEHAGHARIELQVASHLSTGFGR